jgi:glycosyltransferase involved in cell wall biosynthesis
MAPTVSVLVPTRNRGKRLPELLDALSSEPVSEMVIVVNGSQDGSLGILEERALPGRQARWVARCQPESGG